MTSTPAPNRRPWPQRFFARLAMTPFGAWLIRQVATRVDSPRFQALLDRSEKSIDEGKGLTSDELWKAVDERSKE